MYFDLDDHRPDIPILGSPWSTREGVMVSIILHLLVVIVLILGPELPWVKAAEARRLQAIEEERRAELERQRESARFVFVQPRLDIPAPKPPDRYEFSDIDRQARTVERAPEPTNSLPFSRGNTSERIEATSPVQPRGQESAQPADRTADGSDQTRQGLTLPDAQMAGEPRSADSPRQATNGTPMGVLADAIRNVQKYAQKDGFVNLRGGGEQDFGPAIQFDTKGVEFGPWIRRFVAQIRRNWFIPYAAMSMHGRVVLTFYVGKDGRLTELRVIRPSEVDAFTNSAYNALAASNPTYPLPPEYPDDRAFFTVTFFFNEDPGR